MVTGLNRWLDQLKRGLREITHLNDKLINDLKVQSIVKMKHKLEKGLMILLMGFKFWSNFFIFS